MFNIGKSKSLIRTNYSHRILTELGMGLLVVFDDTEKPTINGD